METNATSAPETSETLEAWNVVAEEALVPLHATVITTDPDPVAERLAKYEEEGLALGERMQGVLTTGIKDQETYDSAALALTDGKAFIKGTDDFFEPIRTITFALYNRVLGRKKDVQSPVGDRVKPVANLILSFERIQEEERRRLEREATIKQQREEEERKLASAIHAEGIGMDKQSVETILTTPSVASTPAAVPTFQRAAGVSRREAWCAEVTDFHALVRAVAKDAKLLPLLEANMPALNAQARSLKQALAIPGVRAVDKGSVAVRGGQS
jgi:hypothetical protein